ncbi:MAG: thioredoxin domain-containing protein [Acidobacteriota bacterium]
MGDSPFLRKLWNAFRADRRLVLAGIAVAGVLAGVVLAQGVQARGRALHPGQETSAAGGAQRPADPQVPGGVAERQVVEAADTSGQRPGIITDIPNVDFAGLSPEQKEEVIRLLNERRCDCNCNMSLARCRVYDRSCPRSPEIIARFLSLIRTGAEPVQAAGKMYGESGPRQPAGPAAQAQTAPARDPGKLVRYKIEPDNSPSAGPDDAPVTIIEFIDFQCPFCVRAHGTVERILKEYAGKVRVVFKQHPLPMHPQAMLAAEAALAAHEQGRYRDMHERLFSISRQLSREAVLAAARDLGLDLERFTTSLDSGKHRATAEAETQQAVSLGATGTPAFFINGRYLSGARPFEQLKSVIDEELSGQKKPFVWGKNVRTDEPRGAVPVAKRPSQPAEDPNKLYTIDLDQAASTGPDDAPVTIVEFTDFQCPFCKRVQPTLKQILLDYPKQVRLVTKNLPLPFHPLARGAARAALAAERQGKYWEFRDLIFENPRALDEESLIQHARDLGLDVERFRADMSSEEIDQIISVDLEQAKEVGATGTPTFLINGRKLVGAQPLPAFKQRIDAELARQGVGSKTSR